MRGFAIDLLRRIGIFYPVKISYVMIKSARPALLYNELLYRIEGAPDGYPCPSAKSIYLAIGNVWALIYYQTGKMTMSVLLSHLEKKSINVSNFRTILDFGCGSGRLIRHLRFLSDAELFGTDYNEDLINWCQKNLRFAKFQVNDITPPLSYQSNMFDFIYARSVLTHLNGDLQKQWIAELRRVLKPDGILLFTTHGVQYLESLSREMKKRYESGQLVVKGLGPQGSNPFQSIQSREFVEDNLLGGFELVSHIPGELVSYTGCLRQDVYIVRKLEKSAILKSAGEVRY